MAIPDVCHIILFDGWTFAVGLVGMFQMTKLSELHFIDDGRDGVGWDGMGWMEDLPCPSSPGADNLIS